MTTVSAGLSYVVSTQLSVVNLVKRIVRRVRDKNQAPLPNPSPLIRLNLPSEYRATVRGGNYLPTENRISILELLEQCPY